jgi:hypothetical protein
MSSTLGAPFGGTTRGAHHCVDSEAFSFITPPNFGSGGGSCFPLIVVVAPGAPGVPVICWAMPVAAQAAVKATPIVVLTALRFITFFFIKFLPFQISKKWQVTCGN